MADSYRVLSLALKNNREMVRKSLAQGRYKVSFISALSEVTTTIADFKPNIFIHDWTAVDPTQSRLFHLKFGKSLQSGDIVRVLLAPEVSPALLAFANDALIEKVFTFASASLNLPSQLDMMTKSSEGNELNAFMREIKSEGFRYSQIEIDNKIDELFQKFPHDNRVRLEFGNLNYRQEKFEEAVFLAKDLLMREPQNVRAMNLMARSLMKKGEWDKAFSILDNANVLSPSNPDRLIAMGDALYGKGDLDKAVNYYKQAAHLDADLAPSVRKQIGQIKLDQGHMEEALDLFKKSVSEEEAAGYFNNAAVRAVREGQMEKALALYETALKAVKTDKLKPLIYFNIALSLKRLGRGAEAVKYLRRAVSMNPDFDKARTQLDLLLKKSS